MAPCGSHGFLAEARAEFHPDQLLPSIIAGGIIGISEVIFTLSLGSLIFPGGLSDYLPLGFGIALLTSVIMLIGTSLLSRVPGVISSTQDSTSVVFAVMVAALFGLLGPYLNPDEKLATILVAVSLTTFLTGCVFLAFGFFNLGRLVRYIPYPVVGGFLAGTGWLLVRGSIGVMTPVYLALWNLPNLFKPDQLILWIPGLLFALALFFGLRRFSSYLTLPVILIGAIALFYLAFLLTGTSIQAAIDRGLLLGPMGGSAAIKPFVLLKIFSINLPAVLRQSGNIAAIVTLAVISLLLNASALELAIRQDVQLNHELKVAGFTNLFSGLLGGMVGYHTLSLSTLTHRIGAKGRLPGIIAGLFCLAVFLLGSTFLAYFPKPILGGLLFYLGLDFLVTWLVEGWKKLSHSDYAVVVLILLVIGFTNFLTGVAVGLVAMVILFVVDYGRINVVYHTLSGSEINSNVERCAYHQRALKDKLGQHIYVMELQGFIFFGTANAMLDQLRLRLGEAGQSLVKYVILDFRHVSGFDSSATISFSKCRQIAEAQSISLILSHLSPPMKRRFELEGLSEKQGVRIYPDLDHALEWCEEELLEAERITLLHLPITLSAQLVDSGFAKADVSRLVRYLERIRFEAGDTLIRQDQPADQLFFIETGQVSILRTLKNGEQVRLQTLGLGTAVGEPGMYLHTTNTASAIADLTTIAYRLTHANLVEMKTKEPELAASFHEFMAALLSERLLATTKTLDALMD